jgi:PAS domain-containing protein
MKKSPRSKARSPQKTSTEALLALSRVALDSAAQGVCIYDADNRVVLFNRRFLELFHLSADVIRPGLTTGR